MELKRVLTVSNIQSQRVELIPFEGAFAAAFGRPQNRGFWFAWGGSGTGKSTFMLQLAKALAVHYKVLYNLLEEDVDDSDYIERTKQVGMSEVAHHFFTQRYTLEELGYYLGKRNSAHVVVIDSLPYLLKSWEEYTAFKKQWGRKKVIIWVGHAEGNKPATDLQRRVMFDARMKFYVEGYLATCKGRTLGANGGYYKIWEAGYDKLNGVKK